MQTRHNLDMCTMEDVYGVGGCPRGLTTATASLSTSASLLQDVDGNNGRASRTNMDDEDDTPQVRLAPQ
eukprot:2591245-Pyramimonas_sp.AAC.1